MLGLRWQPQPHETRFDDFEIDADYSSGSDTTERSRGHLEQTLYAIDMQSYQCVTLFSDVLPVKTVRFNAGRRAGDGLTYSQGYRGSTRRRNPTTNSLEEVDHCSADVFLTLRPDADNVFRVHAANIAIDRTDETDDVTPDLFRFFVACVIEQTHARTHAHAHA